MRARNFLIGLVLIAVGFLLGFAGCKFKWLESLFCPQCVQAVAPVVAPVATCAADVAKAATAAQTAASAATAAANAASAAASTCSNCCTPKLAPKPVKKAMPKPAAVVKPPQPAQVASAPLPAPPAQVASAPVASAAQPASGPRMPLGAPLVCNGCVNPQPQQKGGSK